MTDTELTRLSTIAWVIATTALFLLLARWSTGESWDMASGLVAGVRSWSRGHEDLARPIDPSSEELPPLVDMPIRDRLADLPYPGAAGGESTAEIEDLPDRGF